MASSCSPRAVKERGMVGYRSLILTELAFLPPTLMPKRPIETLLRLFWMISFTESKLQCAGFTYIRTHHNADNLSLFRRLVVPFTDAEYAAVWSTFYVMRASHFAMNMVYKVLNLISHPVLRSWRQPLSVWHHLCWLQLCHLYGCSQPCINSKVVFRDDYVSLSSPLSSGKT